MACSHIKEDVADRQTITLLCDMDQSMFKKKPMVLAAMHNYFLQMQNISCNILDWSKIPHSSTRVLHASFFNPLVFSRKGSTHAWQRPSCHSKN